MNAANPPVSGNPESPVPALTGNQRLWSVLSHISYFCGFGVLFLFPLIVYLVMRPEDAYVTHHAREAFNFHLSMVIYALCCIPLCFVLIGVPCLVIIGLVGVVCTIIAAIKASEGVLYRYPITIRFVRA